MKPFSLIKKVIELGCCALLLQPGCLMPLAAQMEPSSADTPLSISSTTPAGIDGTIESVARIDPQSGTLLSLDLSAGNIPASFQQDSFSNPYRLDLGINPLTGQPIVLDGSKPFDESVLITWKSSGASQNEPLSIALPMNQESLGPDTVMISQQAKTVWSALPDQNFVHFNTRVQDGCIVIPWSLVPVSSFKICTNANIYQDEEEIPDYGKEAVKELYARNIMTGTGSGENFSPFQTLTRAQAALILYRVFGRDYLSWPLEGIRNALWYSQAKEYMLYQKIMGNGSDFAPEKSITREELAAILQRIDSSYPSGDPALLDAYPDGSQVSGWAREGMTFCVTNNLMGQGSSLSPQKELSRVETASIIARFLDRLYDANANREPRIQRIYALRGQFLDELNAIAKPVELDQATFDDWKSRAINSYIDDFLAQAQDIGFNTETFLQINAIQSFDNDYSRLLKVLPQLPYGYLQPLTEDWDLYDFIVNYPDHMKYLPAASNTGANLDGIPHYLQWDLRWGYQPYGDSIIGYAGCAPTCLSMVLSYLLKDDSITPGRIADEAMAQGEYCPGVGTYHTIFPHMAQNYGVKCEKIQVDEAAISHLLESGLPIILNMGPGLFTHGGHFIVLSGIEQGKWRVNDPFSIKRSTLWNPQVVLDNCYNQLSGTKNGWAFAI